MFKIGDVIGIPYFPNQEDPLKGKARTVIIVDVTSNGYIIIPMTSQLHQASRYNKTILIRKNDETGRKIGLKFDSLLIIDRKITIGKHFPVNPKYIGNSGQEFILKHNL